MIRGLEEEKNNVTTRLIIILSIIHLDLDLVTKIYFFVENKI